MNDFMLKMIHKKIKDTLNSEEYKTYFETLNKIIFQYEKLYRLINDRVNKNVSESFKALTGQDFPAIKSTILSDEEWDIEAEELISEIIGNNVDKDAE